MDKIRGTNLGNWLVLEKWMKQDLFDGTGVEDETWLNRKLPKEEVAQKTKIHRDSYITENDFEYIAAHGMNMVRIPVPFFAFGDCPPVKGCITYLDQAFEWAEKYGLKVLLDLHTVPDGQNGYDNGGITGVCKWHKSPEKVEFALTVLERLAQRYAEREGLFGIEVLNEPISFLVYATAPTTGKAMDKEEAKGSGYVPMKFLRGFYREAYRRMRVYLPEEKAIVFHDGFRLGRWNSFFEKQEMKNIFLDTHIYVFAMESFVPISRPWIYRAYIKWNEWAIQKTQKVIPVIVGEWCICNKYADRVNCSADPDREKVQKQKERYRWLYALQKQAWEKSAGWFYWNYQLLRDREEKADETWKESWDLCRCFKNQWISEHVDEEPTVIQEPKGTGENEWY